MPIAHGDHSPAQIVQMWLILRGLGSLPPATPWPIYSYSMPATPDDAIALYDTVGLQDGRIQRDGTRPEHPGIQLRVRAKVSTNGYAKAKQLCRALDALNREQVMVDSGLYLLHNVSRSTNILSLGQEEGSERSLFTINALVTYSAIGV